MVKEDTLYYNIILNALDDKKYNKTEDDKQFRNQTQNEIAKRDQEYTQLLSHFVKITRVRNVLKEIFKWTFYLMIIASIIALICMTSTLFHAYVTRAKIEEVIESMPLLITAIVSFVSVIITIPVTITKYLFSTKEDENITEIILHTQKHDTTGREWTSKFRQIANEVKESAYMGTEANPPQNSVEVEKKMQHYENEMKHE